MTQLDQLNQVPHRRYNPLTGEWIFVSPHRNQRPWQGRRENDPMQDRPEHDPGCYLCPGNTRAGGKINPKYENTFVFTNDFAALLPETSPASFNSGSFIKQEAAKGTCRVICFSPNHNLTLAEMEPAEILEVVNTWATEVEELGKLYDWVQIFENKGEIMGCSNPHPHGQIWAGNFLPNEPAKEEARQKEYLEKEQSTLLMDYTQYELTQAKRIVLENQHWVVMVPFWATWPFELLLLPRQKTLRLPDLSTNQRESLADILKLMLVKYDNLFNTSFPYTMGWHGAPFRDGDFSHWQLHAHFYPPLLRSATVKKFMVGYEMLAEAQRDITAEIAADTLRKLSHTHFKKL